MKLHHRVKHHLKRAASFCGPHPETHKKTELLHWHYLIIYLLIFMLLRVGIDLYGYFRPGVLGIEANITIQQIIENTNKERQAKGLSPLKENNALSAAAAAKAKNMFDENYWAHFSPSGKDPWGFIKGAGYGYTYAGENLARNYYNADDVVKAWMNSPTHRDNLLNSRYQDIGIAVLEGTLQGQKTTLIVQMFGTPYNAVAVKPNAVAVKPEVNAPAKEVTVKEQSVVQVTPPSSASAQTPVRETPRFNQTVLVAGTQNPNQEAVIDPNVLIKASGMVLAGFLALLIMIDMLVLRRRGVFRISSHHLAHLGLISLLILALLVSKIGNIL